MKKTGFSSLSLYILFIFTGILFLAPPLAAQVDKSELSDLGPVEFINYEGPYSRIETRAQIRSIGYGLGQIVKGGASAAGAQGRYFVIHSVSAPDGMKLDADIFGLGVDVGVDHIRNLRLIIQGYLEAAYEYTEKDAALLAEYITVYNAVYRGDIEYFGSRYKKPVMSHLTAQKAGLALRYDEWPGQTLMLIPLGTGIGGPLSAVDTTPITDSRVIESLRQEPGASLDQRKEMVDLKEREAEVAGQQAAIQKEAIKQEEERIAKAKEEAAVQQQQAREEQQRIAKERLQPGADQEALDAREKEAEELAKEARAKQEELDKQQKALEDAKREADQQEAFAQQKAQEAQQERQGIAADQQATIDNQARPGSADGILGVSIIIPGTSTGRLVRLNANTGRETKVSPLNTMNTRTVTQVGGRIFAIAAETRGGGAVRIVEMNANTLDMQKQGDDNIAANSLLWVNGQDLYAIISEGSDLYLARFNLDLVRQARSAIPVNLFASVFFSDAFLATQRADGSAVLLNAGDLTEKK